MIKKTLAISLILLANLILLAYAAIPHHHHKNEVCFEDSHCHHHNDAHDHDAEGESHDHDNSEGEHPCCELSQITATPLNQTKPEVKCIDFTDDFKYSSHLLFTFENLNLARLLSAAKIKCRIDYSPTVNSQPLSLHTGLRAPPIV